MSGTGTLQCRAGRWPRQCAKIHLQAMSSNQSSNAPGCEALLRWLALLVFILVAYSRGSAAEDPGDELFTNGPVRHVQIEISEDGMKVLRDYHQVWGQPRPERTDVRATVRQGN